MFKRNLTRNQKIDLATGLVTGATLVGQFAYNPAPTLLLNGLRAATTLGWGIIGSEIIKRIVNGPQDQRVTTCIEAPES